MISLVELEQVGQIETSYWYVVCPPGKRILNELKGEFYHTAISPTILYGAKFCEISIDKLSGMWWWYPS